MCVERAKDDKLQYICDIHGIFIDTIRNRVPTNQEKSQGKLQITKKWSAELRRGHLILMHGSFQNIDTFGYIFCGDVILSPHFCFSKKVGM